MLMKICANCGKKIKQGAICSCRQKNYDSFQRDKKKKEFYHSLMWSKVSKLVKERASGLDEVALSEGRLCKGNLTHHIYTIEERPDLKLSASNLIYVSTATHNMIHAEYDKGMEQRQAMQNKLIAVREGR